MTSCCVFYARRHGSTLHPVQHEPALQALHDHAVLDGDAINAFPRRGGTRWLFPRSRLLNDELRPALMPLIGDVDSYTRLGYRTEYRIALAQHLARKTSASRRYRAAPGEFIGDYR